MASQSPISATAPCRQCGAEISAIAEICPYCGVRQFSPARPADVSEHGRALAAVLCFLFGVFGVHRFIVGKVGTGVLQLLTLGGLGIWWLVDFIMILAGEFRDKAGRKLTEWG